MSVLLTRSKYSVLQRKIIRKEKFKQSKSLIHQELWNELNVCADLSGQHFFKPVAQMKKGRDRWSGNYRRKFS